MGVAWALTTIKVDEAFRRVTSKVLKENQKRAIITSVIDKRDVVVIMPTGYGKSLIYFANYLQFSWKNSSSNSSCIGVSAAFIGEERNDPLSGDVSVVYSSPEAIMSSKWRRMLKTKSWQDRLTTIAIDEAHCICEWYVL